jgi:flavin reductase (DIM6/NTAB) family NADH-FMN oxidoreductase RutF
MKDQIQPEELKQAMRAWITGVTIVTGRHNGQIHGMTANSFNSIALSPPTVLVALQSHSRTRAVVHEGGVFGVTILETDQMDLAKRFAGHSDTEQPRFEGVDTFSLVTGAPLLKGGMAYLDCKVINAFEVGPSTVYLGKVLAAQNSPQSTQPLLYFNRQWRRLESI